MTDSNSPVKDETSVSRPESPIPSPASHAKDHDEEPKSPVEEEQVQETFTDAVDEGESQDGTELSQVICALQGSVAASEAKNETKRDKETAPETSEPSTAANDQEETNEVAVIAVEQDDETAVEPTPTPTPTSVKEQQQQPEEKEEEKDGQKTKESPAAVAETEVPLSATSEPTTPKPESRKIEGLTVMVGTEAIRKSIEVPAGKNMADYVTPPTPGLAPPRENSEEHQDATDDNEYSKSSSFTMANIDLKNVGPNTLNPRDQEKADEEMLRGMNLFFNNKFSKAKAVFETHAKEDPLYALGLGSMAFIKAITSSDSGDADIAIASLLETYRFAGAQIDAASAKKPLKDTVSHYITNLMGNNPTNLPTNTSPLNQQELNKLNSFLPNGALRAHVIKAECSLLMAIIHLNKETVAGYLKCGLNLRRAYNSYSLVWQEYKRMGQDFHTHLDQDTISAIQFGIGSVHLLLSSLPPKILKVVSAFGWNADRHLGFALLKLCLEGKRIRSPLASITLLSYYVILTSYAPQILTRELIQPAIECLLDAQQSYPNSAFFLYFAGRVSRLAKNLSLSTQSFMYTYEVSQGEWAEGTMGQLATYEIAFNCAMGLDWASAAVKVLELQDKQHSSPAFLKYVYGACMEMLGNRTEAILAFAEASQLIDKKKKTELEQYVAHRIEFFEQSGYQDLGFSLPALEILFMWNMFPNMTENALERCLEHIDTTLESIYEREKQEYEVRIFELAPGTPTPDYFEQRGCLLLMKSSVLNSLGRERESIVHLNWIIDHRECMKTSKWILPFTYWESGITSWKMEEFQRARALWETALSYSSYDFEYRLAIRLNLAITHAVELGIPGPTPPKAEKGPTTNGRKRMSIVSKVNGTVQT
ncbi:uncharacterized protein BYT42DRAFT_616685 [Radiomyces spectabilis]|uniref:uncharacterized protein n=1 Tax=Radiomyces spectabilis TaxID=64574 RepID=UPI00222080C3|nr:uncharacterized protein BYT42DRAFT_616685 [Radiomyces spectabilis]KAI8371607.1 hypothetical protein BYT42DRAFT_616685 [Radiomyces spectabilis]